MKNNKTLIFIPTYNEKENVEKLYSRITELQLNIDILFLDDNSPDGTGILLEGLSKIYQNVNVIHRAKKLGIGSAHLMGIEWAYDNKYEKLITMDCDFTHSPEYLPVFIKYSKTHDIVIGSRYMLKESLQDWNPFRKSLTLLGHILTKYLLKITYDASGAYRLYRLDKIPRELFNLVSSAGYSFFFESLYILYINSISIKELPIILPSRTYGHSKMKFKDAWHSWKVLFTIYLMASFDSEKFKSPKPCISEINSRSSLNDNQGWEEYWEKQKDLSGSIYNVVAACYRKFIIRRTLNFFIKKHFQRGSEILHAGCGSGQVDTGIHDYISVTALDISREALNLYKKANTDHRKLLYGNLFNIPLLDVSVDGVYNLGVMEHFTEAEIAKILKEFDRVLKPNGKVVIFWPPEFGISVTFLKLVQFILKKILKKNIKLHPNEISRVKSKKHIEAIFGNTNFRIIDYYFGLRDFFTYAVIVIEKDKMALASTGIKQQDKIDETLRLCDS